MNKTIVLLISLILGLSFAIGSASASVRTSFRTPSGNIQCVYSHRDLSCIVLSEQLPSVYQGKKHVYTIAHPTPTPYDDLVLDDYVYWMGSKPASVLAYGKSVRLNNSVVCKSRFNGLTCTSRSAHGFFLSRQAQNVW